MTPMRSRTWIHPFCATHRPNRSIAGCDAPPEARPKRRGERRALGRSRRVAAPSGMVIVHPSLAEAELKERQRENGDEEDPRERARIAHPEVLERLTEEVIRI